MKPLFYFLFTALVLSSAFKGKEVLFAQPAHEYVVYYDYFAQLNKADTSQILKERMMLLLGSDRSRYLSQNKYISDSMLNEQVQNVKLVNGVPHTSFQGMPRPKVNYSISKELGKNLFSYSNVVGVHAYYYGDTLTTMSWQLADDKKDLLGYTCYKATTRFAGRDYIAWYAANIPLSDGPYKFNGLPGLILEIYDTQNHFRFVAVGLESINNVKAGEPIPSRYKKLKDEKAYKDLYKKFRNDPTPFFETDGIRLPSEMTEKAAQMAKEAIKMQNNPMELDEG